MSHTRRLVNILLSISILLSMALSLARPEPAAAQGKDGLDRQLNAQTGKLSFIAPEDGQPLSAAKVLGISPSARAEDPAMALAKRFGPEFGLQDAERDLRAIKTDRPGDGRVTVHYQQSYEDIPVLGGELIANTNETGDLYSINGEVSSKLSLSTQAAIDAGQARETALQSMAKWYEKTPEDFIASEPELWVYDESLLRPSSRPVELVWRMEVTAVDAAIPVREFVLINAQRGNISLHFNQMDTAWRRPINADTVLAAETNNYQPTLQAGSATIRTYTAGNGTFLPGTFLCNQTDPNCAAGDAHAKAAHKYAIGTYNLYLAQHSRKSIDNADMPVISTVHYGVGYDNAFWSGGQMVYGDGYGFALADDVVAHELTHGVTQFESNLFYYYQSGAINESFSDFWGEYYDQTNGQGNDVTGVRWQIGEDVTVLGTMRNMSDPTVFGDPDSITSPYYYEGAEDYGGVHTNSGVNNKAVFLMVDGGTFNGKTVSPLGWDKTAAIYYEANTRLLSSGADYSDLYYALQTACTNLIGQKGITSGDCAEVKDAVDAVEMNAQPAPNFNTDAPLCGQDLAPSIKFADDLEYGTGNWTFTNGANIRWQLDSIYGPYAQSGLHSLYADDFPEEVTDASARLTVLTVPWNAYLHFAHAYGFEDNAGAYYDGGVLEYSINGGASWLDAGSLIDYNGYKGTIFGGAGNPLANRSAFVGDSHGYVSTRLNLASLAGQTVTFRWRMGLDQAIYDWGWWVDNIKIYTCGPVAASLVAPSGNIGSIYNPTYAWNKVSTATWYYLWVNGPAGNVMKQWYHASAICIGSTCSVTPAKMLGLGNHTWWIQTWSEAGDGIWSSAKDFTITPVGAATLTSPNGNIGTNYTPTYTWNITPNAVWYYLWVDGPDGKTVFNRWYLASDICSGSTCLVTAPKSLNIGQHTWWIQTWTDAGYGPWSDAMTFTTTTSAPPGGATLVSPAGAIGDTTPTYTWNKVAGATWYYLWVDGPSGNVLKQWYDAAEVCGASTCSVTPPNLTLPAGNYTWWVRAWNPGGYGPWSDPGVNFNLALPGAATLNTPSGAISDTSPTYTWNKVSNSTWYYLWVNKADGTQAFQPVWYEASAICGASTCSVTPDGVTLGSGTHTWWIRTYNDVGYGPWSSGKSFSLP